MEPKGSTLQSQGFINNPYSQLNQSECSQWPLLKKKTHSNIFLPYKLRSSKTCSCFNFTCYNIESFCIFSYSQRLNHPDYIRLMARTMKLLIVKVFHSPFGSQLDPKISIWFLFSNIFIRCSFLNVRSKFRSHIVRQILHSYIPMHYNFQSLRNKSRRQKYLN